MTWAVSLSRCATASLNAIMMISGYTAVAENAQAVIDFVVQTPVISIL
jgi:hypothetical protein